MKISELIESFTIYMTNEERELIGKLNDPKPLNSFKEHEIFVIENMIRKGLVIKINNTNPLVIANELE